MELLGYKMVKSWLCFFIISLLAVLWILHSLQVNTADSYVQQREIATFGKISPPKGTQMSVEQIAAILKVLPTDGNLLVWGLGHDSPLWHNSTKGKVVFIEDSESWLELIKRKYPFLNAYKISYSTLTSLDTILKNPDTWKSLDIRFKLPENVISTRWHVVVVDGPAGHIGRHQTIYTSMLLAKDNTHIFVDDYERESERLLSEKFLGIPVDVVKRTAHDEVGENEQAHFILQLNNLKHS